jgi:hypothetical protein
MPLGPEIIIETIIYGWEAPEQGRRTREAAWVQEGTGSAPRAGASQLPAASKEVTPIRGWSSRRENNVLDHGGADVSAGFARDHATSRGPERCSASVLQ